MSDTPAEKSLRRVLFVSALDGWSVAFVAGFSTLLSLLFSGWIGVVIGALITAGGIIELRGRNRLMRGDAGGMSALVCAQLIILGTFWIYSAGNLLAYDEAAIMAQITPDIREAMSQLGVTVADLQAMMKPVFFGFYLVIMLVTLLFQGGLALYYHSRRAKVAAALAARSPAPPAMPLPSV
jgi:hypothetical protein